MARTNDLVLGVVGSQTMDPRALRALLTDFIAGHRKQHRGAKTVFVPAGADNEMFQELADFAGTEGHQVDPIPSPDTLVAVLKHWKTLGNTPELFVLADEGEIANSVEVYDAIAAATAEGLKVRSLVEGLGQVELDDGTQKEEDNVVTQDEYYDAEAEPEELDLEDGFDDPEAEDLELPEEEGEFVDELPEDFPESEPEPEEEAEKEEAPTATYTEAQLTKMAEEDYDKFLEVAASVGVRPKQGWKKVNLIKNTAAAFADAPAPAPAKKAAKKETKTIEVPEDIPTIELEDLFSLFKEDVVKIVHEELREFATVLAEALKNF